MKTLTGGKATSDYYTPLVVGTYYFKAVYSGDGNYNSAESGDTDEPLTVSKMPVGGEWAPTSAAQLLTLCIGLAATTVLAASFAGIKRIRKRQN